jgi:hypothetical protein
VVDSGERIVLRTLVALMIVSTITSTIRDHQPDPPSPSVGREILDLLSYTRNRSASIPYFRIWIAEWV